MFKSSTEIILAIFLFVENLTCDLAQHPQSKLHPSEIVTLALLWRLKDSSIRRFHIWAQFTGLFPNLPDHSRLFRLFQHYKPTIEVLAQSWSQEHWAVVDSTGVELIHPIRQGRTVQNWHGKNKSKGRWYVGQKVAILVSPSGQIMNWECLPANAHDTWFENVFEEHPCIVLGDFGFKRAKGHPDWLVICQRGECNERMVVESAFSQMKRLLGFDKIRAKTKAGFELAVTCIVALFNTLLELNSRLGIEYKHPAIAHWCVL